MKIFLVGLPGSGKTTLGKEVAKKLQLEYIDLDEEIERGEGMPISKIFEEKGEPYFRQVESGILKKVGQSSSFIMATGGGTPCYFNNMHFMNDEGDTVFLDVSPEEINKRLKKKDLAKRPLFKSKSDSQTTEYLLKLRIERLTYYRQAKFILSDNSIEVDALINQIIKN